MPKPEMDIFPRPARPRDPRPPVRAAPRQPGTASPAGELAAPRPDSNGTFIALAGIALTGVFMHGEQPSDMARFAALGVGASIAISVAMDARRGLRNLPRADLFAILAYYFLTLFEFLFPQSNFDSMIGLELTREGLVICLVGFGSLFAGRHLWRARRQPFEQLLTHEIPPSWLITLFWVSFFVGYLHMLIAVDFNVAVMVDAFLGPRFSQPWSRGQFGDWKALIFELGLFIQLVPPLAGIMIARRHRYSMAVLVPVAVALAFTLFYAFTSGTRNLFASYLVTFLIGYAFSLPAGRGRELLALTIACALAICFSAFFMLQFRTVGLKNYFSGRYVPPETKERTLYVDYNLYTICRLVEAFPKQHDYLGWETPYQALVRPIPRAIWSGKPEGLSVTMETVLGLEGLTIGASFAGEAYMSGGILAVIIVGLIFGAITGWWSYLASPKNSELGILIYASGFFAVVISMRSLFVFSTALLPTVAAIVIGSFAVHKLVNQSRRFLRHSGPGPRRPPPPPRPGPRGVPKP